jgi:transketolase
MRQTFAKTLYHLAETDARIVFVTADMGFQMFDPFKAAFGPRYVNVGVAEAQMIDMAAGLALEGWRPVVYSIASFATGRAFEQIRLSLGYHRLPVVVTGAGGGYAYAASGVTHHAAEDLGLMSLLPGMTVVAPGDGLEVAALLPQLLSLDGPSYLRLGRNGEPVAHTSEPAVLGRGRMIRPGERVAVITTGDLAAPAAAAADRLAPAGLTPAVCQMHTVKPIDRDMLARLAAHAHTFIVAEEHLPMGGLWAGVSAWRTEADVPVRILRLGPPDALVLGNPSREELRRNWGHDADGIETACRRAWH